MDKVTIAGALVSSASVITTSSISTILPVALPTLTIAVPSAVPPFMSETLTETR